tara:strand:+ start:1646 stop:2335 length:690 start_codon:yes stop_codon:yes gene_type:complete
MYFQNFPYTYYSLDNTRTVQVVTDITNRAVISDEVKTNLGLYDEYDIKDGETPELVADRFYNNPELHWIVLQYNDIIDPRFDWPLDTNNLTRYVTGKYYSLNGIHHYEDANLAITNGNVIINANVNYLNVGNVVVNLSGTGTGYVTSKINSSNIFVRVTSGGFITGDVIANVANTVNNSTITATRTISGTPVTNYVYEDGVNESKRRIKILKTSYVDAVVRDFKKKLGE